LAKAVCAGDHEVFRRLHVGPDEVYSLQLAVGEQGVELDDYDVGFLLELHPRDQVKVVLGGLD